MKMNVDRKAVILITGLASILLLSRILPHIPNFTGSLAAIIFSASVLRSWRALAVLFLSYLLSDIIINNWLYSSHSFVWISDGFYWILLPYLLIFILVKSKLSRNFKPLSILSISFLSSVIFFLLSNFGVWMTSVTLYSKDAIGLGLCYLNALPYFGYELAGTLFYSCLYFSTYWLFSFEFLQNEQNA